MSHIADVIYGLKHECGKSLTVGRTDSTFNAETGVQTPTTTEFTVQNAILLPRSWQQDLIKGIYVQSGQQLILIDKSDLTQDILINDTVTHEGKTFRVIEIDDYADALILKVKEPKQNA